MARLAHVIILNIRNAYVFASSKNQRYYMARTFGVGRYTCWCIEPFSVSLAVRCQINELGH